MDCNCNAPLSDWTDYHGQTYGLHHREGCPLRMTEEEYFDEGGQAMETHLKQDGTKMIVQIVGTES